MARRQARPDRVSVAGSLAVHTVAAVLAWWTSVTVRPTIVFESYEIELVSAPPLEVAAEVEPAREELVVERPEPEPPVEREEAPVAEPEPTPEPPVDEPPPQVEPEPDPEPEEEPQVATTDEPPAEELARESGEDINVRIEGLRRDYPAYYENIIRQIQRCFAGRFRGEGSWETTVYFVIQTDGAVEGLDFVSRSGNTNFDFEAMGAVECAGRGRFGPLPEDLPYERLPVEFTFRPGGGADMDLRGLLTDELSRGTSER